MNKVLIVGKNPKVKNVFIVGYKDLPKGNVLEWYDALCSEYDFDFVLISCFDW